MWQSAFYPDFDMSKQYVYLESLKDNNINLYEGAYRATHSINLSKDLDNSYIIDAIKLIDQLTISEREKEMRVIKSFLNKNKKAYPEELNINLNSADPESFYNFYLKMIQLINEYKKTADDYKYQLELMKKTLGQDFSELKYSDYRFDAGGIIKKILKDLTNEASRIYKNTLPDLIRSSLINFFSNEINSIEKNEILNTPEKIASMAILYLTDSLRHISKESISSEVITTTKGLQKNDKLRLAIEDELEKFSEEETKTLQAMDDTELINKLNEIQDFFKIKIETPKENERNSKKNKKKDNQPLYNSVIKSISGVEDFDFLKHLSFSVKEKSYGNINELLTVLIQQHAQNVRSNVGTDIMSFNISVEIKNSLEQELTNRSNEILSLINTEFSKAFKSRKSNWTNDKKKTYEDMNDTIDSALKQLDEFIKNNKESQNEIDRLFIFHESLKLYAKAATNNPEFQSFHGRSMVILNYLAEIYSMSDIVSGIFNLPDYDTLKLIAINLSDDAIAHDQLHSLEHYLSIFAGLLMFDDVRNIAREALISLERYENIDIIHVYNLNGIYVPASFILAQVNQAVKQAQQLVENKYAATTTISPAKINYDTDVANKKENNDTVYLYKHTAWEDLGKAVASNTKVNISFLAGFISLIDDLFNRIN